MKLWKRVRLSAFMRILYQKNGDTHTEEFRRKKKQIDGIYDDNFEVQIHMSIQWNAWQGLARHGTEQSGKADRTVNDANVRPHERTSSIVVQYS